MTADRNIPRTISPELVRELWGFVKEARDDLACLEARLARTQALLERMKAEGMAEWIPTIEEVREAWNADR